MKIGQGPDVISTKKPFLGGSPKFGQKKRLNLRKDQPKSGSSTFDVVSSLRNSPPPLQIPGYAPAGIASLAVARLPGA